MGHTVRMDLKTDRARGVLIASASGDALGVPYEFGMRALEATGPVMHGGGLGPYAPGEWSDDTQMATSIMQAFTAFDPDSEEALDAITDNWIEWLHSGATDVGNQTRAVLSQLTLGPGSAARARKAAKTLHAQTGRTAGNGSLMRTAPVALVAGTLEEVAHRARRVSDLTHPDPLAGDACVLWCIAINKSVYSPRTGGLNLVREGLHEGIELLPVARRAGWTDWIKEAEDNPSGKFSPNGYVVSALQAAWSSMYRMALKSPDPEAIMSVAVRVGDDTDTVAAITGSILGAAAGESTLPISWIKQVHGWPGLNSADLRSYADKLLGVK